MTQQYETPLSSRYASQYMLELFSADTRYQTWRRLWVALAKAEMELGLPVTQAQVDELAAHITDIDYDCVKEREKEVRHDVMAHVYAYGKVAPSAAGIIHLGATSCYVTDNADLVIYRDGLKYLRGELLGAMKSLCAFAEKYKDLKDPTADDSPYYEDLEDALITIANRIGIITRLDFSIPFLTPSTITHEHARTKSIPYPNGANGAEMKLEKNSPDRAAASPIGAAPVNAMTAYAFR